jgi:hypothetical protein
MRLSCETALSLVEKMKGKDYSIGSDTIKNIDTIAKKTKNIKVHLCLFKILDITFTQNWFKMDMKKDTWDCIYLVNFIFEEHDIFVGSFIAQRMLGAAKKILEELL